MGGGILFFLVALSLATPWLIPLLYGSDYAAYSYVVWGYCLLYVFVFIGYPIRYYFRSLHTTKPIFIAYVVGGGFSLLAAFPIIELGGLTGLLVGLMLSQILTLVFYFFYIRVARLVFNEMIIKPH